jgi:predicted ester cyclase
MFPEGENQMSATDVVRTVLAALEAGDMKKADSLIADDMVFAGPMPQAIGKREFLGLQGALRAAIPDWKFNASEYKEQGDQVMAKVHINGSNTAPLSLPALGIQSLPPTGKHVQLPYEPITVTVKNGKVTRLEAGHVEGGGVPGLLAQLGVAPAPGHNG